MARRNNSWLEDPTAPEHEHDHSDRHSSFHSNSLHFPYVRASKSLDEMSRLRKLTSLSYLSGKVRGMFHREHRDTIVCEDDEESPSGSKRNIYDIIRRNELSRRASTGFDHLAKFSDAVPTARPAALSHSVSLPAETSYEPSKEQRWCTNCSKCFQRGLSRFDQYCGLDCKTAHRMRQNQYYLAAQSPSLMSEGELAVRAAATRPPPHFTTTRSMRASQRRG